MGYRANRINYEILDGQSSPLLDDWRQNQSGGFFRRTIDTLLGILAFILFLLYPTVFMLL